MVSDDSAASVPDDLLSRGEPFGHFIVPRRQDGSLWELGRGAMGVTYRAFDTNLRTEVALKVIRAEQVADESTRRRFQREARAAAHIRHPNVAHVLYLGEQEKQFYYAMELVAGRSLGEVLQAADGPQTPIVALALAAQIAAALAAAHRQEVIHRDLKPANLMVLEADRIQHEDERTQAAGGRQLKVIDFGLARSFGSRREHESFVTQTLGGFIGTPAYASPEQFVDGERIDGRSDIYSLGVILWEMLAGRLPFQGSVAEVIGKHQFQPPPLEQLAGLPPTLIELLAKLLAKDPADRLPQTAGELRSLLDEWVRYFVATTAAALIPSASAAHTLVHRAQASDVAQHNTTPAAPDGRKANDWNVCEHCSIYLGLDVETCPNCEQPLLFDARGKIVLWRLGYIPDGIVGNLAAGLREAFGVGAVIQLAYLDERLSSRPTWKGLSAGVFLNQVERRHQEGVFVNLGVTMQNIVPNSRYNFLFGYAYLGVPAAVVSVDPLREDEPDDEILVERLLHIAIHEIGHTLGLDHHGYDDGVECVMIGDEEIDSLDEVDRGASTFCPACQKVVARARKKLG